MSNKKPKTLIELRYELIQAAQAKLISVTFEDECLSIKFLKNLDLDLKDKVKRLNSYIKNNFDGIQESYIHTYQDDSNSIIQYEIVIVHSFSKAFNREFELL